MTVVSYSPEHPGNSHPDALCCSMRYFRLVLNGIRAAREMPKRLAHGGFHASDEKTHGHDSASVGIDDCSGNCMSYDRNQVDLAALHNA